MFGRCLNLPKIVFSNIKYLYSHVLLKLAEKNNLPHFLLEDFMELDIEICVKLLEKDIYYLDFIHQIELSNDDILRIANIHKVVIILQDVSYPSDFKITSQELKHAINILDKHQIIELLDKHEIIN